MPKYDYSMPAFNFDDAVKRVTDAYVELLESLMEKHVGMMSPYDLKTRVRRVRQLVPTQKESVYCDDELLFYIEWSPVNTIWIIWEKKA